MRFEQFPEIKRVKGGRPDENWESEAWAIFCEAMAKGRNKEDTHDFLDSLFPKKERQKIVKRIVVWQRLRQGYKYREIENELGVSQQTISAIKEAFLNGDYRGYNVRYANSRKKREIRKWNAAQKRREKMAEPRKRVLKYGKGTIGDPRDLL